MRVLPGTTRCEVAYRFKQAEIDKKLLAKSDVLNKIQERFQFSPAKIPEKIDEESIEFAGGRITTPEGDVVIDKLEIGTFGLMTGAWSSTDKAEAMLNEVVALIDDKGLFEPLSSAAKTVMYESACKAHLELDSERLFSPSLMTLLTTMSRELAGEDFDTEVHAAGFIAALVMKPNLLRIGARSPSLSVPELSNLIRQVRPIRIEVGFEGIDDFHNRNYSVKTDMPFARMITMLEELERVVGIGQRAR